MLVGAARERARPSFGAGGLGAADALALPLYDGGDPDDSDPNRSRVALTFRIRRVRVTLAMATRFVRSGPNAPARVRLSVTFWMTRTAAKYSSSWQST